LIRKIVPIVISTIHDPSGAVRRGVIANLNEIVSTGKSPSALYKDTEGLYWLLLTKLKSILSKGRLGRDDWAAIGDLVSKFKEDLKGYSQDFGFEVINLPQALAEDLRRDVNTIQAYLIYSEARRNRTSHIEGESDEAVLETLKSSERPMTPRQISAASGVNYNTVRRLMRDLLRGGKVIKGRARGTYLAK
jgi:predicted transcriptional regulator